MVGHLAGDVGVDVGPVSTSFRGGIKLAAVMRKMTAALDDGRTVRVGFQAGAHYPDGLLVAKVALWNEFGTKHSPARPAIRTMIAEKSPTWGPAMGKLLVTYKYDSDIVLTMLGEGMKGQMVESIRNWTEPPNAPSTIAHKGFDKPWIETSLLIRSVDYEVSAK